MRHILCTVTNDLSYDQRMHRICTSLARNGYRVTLLGRVLPHSIPLETQAYEQKRLRCRFSGGFLFYAEFNLRLLLYLMRAEYDAVCSVDLDSLPAGWLATLFRRKKRLFDAHEYFTEVPEVTHRPAVKFFWELVARLCLPFYRHAYTVGPALAAIFEKKYGLPFGIVRNVPVAEVSNVHFQTSNFKSKRAAGQESTFSNSNVNSPIQRFLLYQGALNEGRGIEQVLAAMQQLEDLELWLAGEGDLSGALRQLALDLGVWEKVRFLGRVKPDDLQGITRRAWLGLNLLENKGLSYYYSLANKFFDYVHAGIPSLTMNFPEYRALNTRHEVALLLDQLSPEAIVSAIWHLQNNPEIYKRLQQASRAARQEWNWENEEGILLTCWQKVFR